MKLVHGIWIPDGDTTFAKVLQRHGGEYQLNRYEEALPHIKRRRVALDIGAHIGMYTRHMVRHFQLVHAFEPMPDNFECLEMNTQGFGNVHNHHCAVGAVKSRCEPLGNAGKSVSWKMMPKHDGIISVVALDDCFTNTFVDFIKIDVEGMEHDVLLGAEEIIRKHKPVVLIEEKFDATRATSKYLTSVGMICAWRKKNDYLFIWC